MGTNAKGVVNEVCRVDSQFKGDHCVASGIARENTLVGAGGIVAVASVNVRQLIGANRCTLRDLGESGDDEGDIQDAVASGRRSHGNRAGLAIVCHRESAVADGVGEKPLTDMQCQIFTVARINLKMQANDTVTIDLLRCKVQLIITSLIIGVITPIIRNVIVAHGNRGVFLENGCDGELNRCDAVTAFNSALVGNQRVLSGFCDQGVKAVLRETLALANGLFMGIVISRIHV